MKRTVWAASILISLGAVAAEAATFTVTNTNDSGGGSLRAAITAANGGGAGPHTINFTANGTISVLSALPTVSQPTTIQPPSINTITLSGTSAGAGVNGLTLGANGCVVKSMIIRNFGGNGIVVNSNGNTIGGSGAQRNVISANGGAGILVTGGSNSIFGNRIGTDNNGNLDNGNAGNGITIQSGSNTVDSNIIGGNNGAGVVLSGAAASGNAVRNNFIGIRGDATGTVGNSGNGITLTGTGANVIGMANVISGNGGVGLLISGGTGGTDVIGNAIGTNLEQTAAMANASHGVEVDNSPNNRIGVDAEQGTTNTISGNGGNGVYVHGASATGTQIYGNALGYGGGGTHAVPNALRGIAVVGSSNVTIGSAISGQDNTIAGNGQDGIYISGGSNNLVFTNEIGITLGDHAVPNNGAGIFLDSTTNALIDTSLIGGNAGSGIRVVGGSGSSIIGNMIGLALSGLTPVGNLGNGISLENTTGITIGTSAPGKGNTISGNGGSGIAMTNSSGNVINAGVIGLNITATGPMPNGAHGVYLLGSSNNHIGTLSTATYIQNNAGSGVAILSGTGNRIRGVRLAGNGGLGIDLDRNGSFPQDGVTHNDSGDVDGGGNALLNAPVLTSSTTTSVNGHLRGAPGVEHTIDLYWSTSCDPAGFGEGVVHLQSTTATTNGSGTAPFGFLGWSPVAGTSAYSATATDPSGNTSEFSQCISPGRRPVETLTFFNTTSGAAALTSSLTHPLPATALATYVPGPPLQGQQASWVMGDWNGDGIQTPGAYASGGAFYFTNDIVGTFNWTGIWFGFQNRPAIAGRFDAAVAHDCIGVVDTAVIGGENAFAVYWTCAMAAGNPTKQSIWLGTPLSTAGFGNIGAHQFTMGNFTGSGADTVAIRRGPYIAWGGTSAQYFGAPGSGYGNVVAGDWDGDGISTFGLYYQNGDFYRLNDLLWHTENYSFQNVGQPIGTPTTPASWRPGGS